MLIVVMAACIGIAALRMEMISIEDQVLSSQEIGMNSLTDILSNRWLEKAATLKRLGHGTKSALDKKSLYDLSEKIVHQSQALIRTEKSLEIIRIMNQVEILTTEANHYFHLILSKQDRQSLGNLLQIMISSDALMEAIKEREFTPLYTFFSSCSIVFDHLIESEYAQASTVYIHSAKNLCQRAVQNCQQYQSLALKRSKSHALDVYYAYYGMRLLKQMLKELVWILVSFHESSWLLYEHNERAPTNATANVMPRIEFSPATRKTYGISDQVIIHPIRLEGKVTVSLARGVYLFTVHCPAHAYALKVDGILHLDQASSSSSSSTTKKAGELLEELFDSRVSLRGNECLVDLSNKTQASIVLYIINPYAKTNIKDVKVTYEKVRDDGYYHRSSSSSRVKEVNLTHQQQALA